MAVGARVEGWRAALFGGVYTPPPIPLPPGEGQFSGALPALLHSAAMSLSLDPALEQTLTAALADPAPHRLEDGNAIRPNYDPELDAERTLRDDSRRVLAKLQLDYAQRYGVASLKIKRV